MRRSVGSSARGPAQRDAGLSLAELLVSMMVLAIVMIMITSFFATGTKVLAQSNAVGRSNGVASNVMNDFSRVLRSATPLRVTGSTGTNAAVITATATALTLYSTIDSPSTRITPAIVRLEATAAGQATASRWSHNAVKGDYFTFPATTAKASAVRTLGDFGTGGSLTFGYLQKDASGSSLTPIALTGGQVAKKDVPNIVAVTITIDVDDDNNSATPPVVVTNTVQLPRLGSSKG